MESSLINPAFNALLAVDDVLQQLKLHSGLPTRANDSDALDLAGCQVSRRNCTGRRRSHICEPAFVMKHQLQVPRLLTENQNHTVGKRYTYFFIVIKAGSDFQNINVIVLYVAILDVNIAWRVLEFQEPDRRDNNLVFGVQNKTVFNGLNHFWHIDLAFYLVKFEYFKHQPVSLLAIFPP
jgi:hypothetical protein